MARREDEPEYVRGQRTAVRLMLAIKNKLLLPVRILTSKFALRAYLTSILFFLTGLFLFACAVVAYVLFYWSYIPRIGFTRDIHLQFDPLPIECRSYLGHVSNYATTQYIPPITGATPPPQSKSETNVQLSTRCAGTPSPWGTAPISPEVISQQAYDVVVELTMPRTPLNAEAGNFMVDARLLSSPAATDSIPSYVNNYDPFAPASSSSQPENPLAHARRPALLPYQPPLVTLFSAFTALPRYVLGLPTSTVSLRVPLFTKVSFPRGRRAVPSQIHIQLQNPSGVQLQVYDLQVHFRARFTGLRYLMYNFRTASACVFVSAFFIAEMVAAAIVYGFLSFVVFGGKDEAQGRIKDEVDKESDAPIKQEEETETETERMSATERTFPSYGGGMATRFTQKKREDGGEGSSRGVGTGEKVLTGAGGSTTMTPGPGGEADDEDDEDADFVLNDTGRWRDSGLGTSMESGRDRDSVRRRRSRPSSRDGPLR
ncbi:Seipin [Elsinoe australis]|uniref:Seipin n=1 Tax=Elsinoe australis TaxID=40998 RepID=A0A2P8A625_9PEZI|nr:Seipin [Elsinoe australis]